MGYEGLIGNTPMVQLRSLSAATGCEVLVKVGPSCETERRISGLSRA